MLGLAFIYIHTSCMRAANALARLRICADSPEPSLFPDAISTEILGTIVIHLSQYVLKCVKNLGLSLAIKLYLAFRLWWLLSTVRFHHHHHIQFEFVILGSLFLLLQLYAWASCLSLFCDVAHCVLLCLTSLRKRRPVL